MALFESALSELLDAFRAGDGVDLIRESVRLVLQELIEAEATEAIGAARYVRSGNAPTNVTVTVNACWRPRPVTSSWGSRSYAKGASSRRSWSVDAGSIVPSTRS